MSEPAHEPGAGGSGKTGAYALSESTGNFADLVAQGTPAPGGGSVAAHAGALAASLGQMMCNLTIGKAKYAEVEPRLKEIRAELERLAARLNQLITEDAESFDGVMSAFRLPKETAEQKAERNQEIVIAARSAINAPLETARRSSRALELLGEIASIGNKNALSDVAVGAQLARAAICGASYNILVNLGMLSDQEESELLRHEITGLVDGANTIAGRIEADLLGGLQ